MEPTISIIVPAYQAEAYLNRCVESIINQTYRHLEIILVNDGSTDKTATICDMWAEKDPRIKVIHKVNEGLSVARNTGLQIAQGMCVYFVDSDDYIAPNLCENILHLMLKESADIVAFNAIGVNEKGEKIFTTDSVEPGVIELETALFELMSGRLSHYAWNKMYKREVFRDIWYPRGRNWEDMATTYKLFLNAKRIYCCEDTYYYYVENSNGIAHNINAKALRDIYIARSESYHELKDRYPCVEEVMFPGLVRSAVCLFDRSLWEEVDRDTLKQATEFLAQNRRDILSRCSSMVYWLYFRVPVLYRLCRRAVHFAGILVRSFKQ